MEFWKDIEGYEGLYQVSNLGRVRSLDRVIQQIKFGGELSPQIYRGRVINPTINGGYYRCSLSKDNIKESKLIHRLVAEAFIPNPNNYPCVNHKDENKLNNVVENLEWCTVQYNTNYGTSPERISINQPLCKRIKVDGIIFHSIREATRYLNCPNNALSYALSHSKIYKGHKIERVD